MGKISEVTKEIKKNENYERREKDYTDQCTSWFSPLLRDKNKIISLRRKPLHEKVCGNKFDWWYEYLGWSTICCTCWDTSANKWNLAHRDYTIRKVQI
jgi:hypothetical protein